MLYLTLSWRRPVSYKNESIDLHSKSVDWFLYDRVLRHERVKSVFKKWLKLNCTRTQQKILAQTEKH